MDAMVTYWCAEGVHGDNRRRHLIGKTLREVKESGGEAFSFDGRCGGTVRVGATGNFDTNREQACECECHED